ncbi:MAG: DUF2971 domain-containing protein [Candidatus Nitrosopumilus sp. bin_68KS]
MFETHTEFKEPSKNPKLWRFMNFTKFVSMLDSNALYFCRSDLLGDSFEGTYTKFSFDKKKDTLKQLFLNKDNAFFESAMKNDKMMHDLWKKSCFISCWHRNEYEPYDMWKTYTQTNEGISIQSSWNRLIKSFKKTQEIVYAGMVDYIDYENEDNSGNLFRKYLTKRKNFSHENELRAIFLEKPSNNIIKTKDDPDKVDWGKIPNGMKININLDDLIEKIVVAPNSPSWFKPLVESLCKKYSFNKPIINSTLDVQPSPY